jgi:hypothetical protein
MSSSTEIRVDWTEAPQSSQDWRCDLLASYLRSLSLLSCERILKSVTGTIDGTESPFVVAANGFTVAVGWDHASIRSCADPVRACELTAPDLASALSQWLVHLKERTSLPREQK